jgi:hypothetical protein
MGSGHSGRQDQGRKLTEEPRLAGDAGQARGRSNPYAIPAAKDDDEDGD